MAVQTNQLINNKKEGLWLYYYLDKLECSINYKDNLYDGIITTYYLSSGNIGTCYNYENDILSGYGYDYYIE
jgi:antitoxin component YwqK of YwqJK toxin-antitoxin module